MLVLYLMVDLAISALSCSLTAARLAVQVEDVAFLTPAFVGLWYADTVVLTAVVPQVAVIYS